MIGKKLIIIGASGHMKDVTWIVESSSDEWSLSGILDDGGAGAGDFVLGPVATWRQYLDHWFVVAIGSPRTRARIVSDMSAVASAKFATLVHASAQISARARIGEGCMVGPGVTISVDARVGRHVILNANVTVAHDDHIGDFCTIAPLVAVSGNVTCDAGLEIGTGASIRQGTRIGRGAMIGMGAVVTRNVEANTCVVGNPARLLKRLPEFGSQP